MEEEASSAHTVMEETLNHIHHRLLAEGDDDSVDAPLWKKVFTIIVVLLMFGVLITDRVGTDSVMLTALTIFYIADIITIKEALTGFSSQGLLTVLVLFVVAEGLNRTGALNWYVAKLLGRPKSVSAAQLRLMLPIAALSGFINDTPLVVVTMPIIIQWAKQINVSTRYLLMPLSFSALLGGVCTLIGTSTNLVVAALLQDGYPNDPRFQDMSLFALGRYGVPVALVGIAYVVLFTPWLLVRGEQKTSFSAQGGSDDLQDLLLGARLTQWSPAAGRTVQRSGLRDTGGIYLVRVKRATTGNIHHAVGPEFVLQVGDILYFTGLVESFGEFCSDHALEVVTNEIDDSAQVDKVTVDGGSITQPLVVDIRSHDNEGNDRFLSPKSRKSDEPIPANIGTSLDALLATSPRQRMRAIYHIEDAIRGIIASDSAVSTDSEDQVIVTTVQNMVVIGIEAKDRSGLLLDLSKCLLRLNLELHHTEAAVVKRGRSLSIWRCESTNLSEEYQSEIWSILHAFLAVDKGAEAVKQRGLRVLRARVLKGRLVGVTAAELNFRETYKAAIVAVQRNSRSVGADSLSTVSFAEGDVLVLQASDNSPLLESPPEDFYTKPALENLGVAELGQMEAADATQEKEAVWRDLEVIRVDEASGSLASREFLTAMKVVKSSSLEGKSPAEAGIDKLPGTFLCSLERPTAVPDTGAEVSSFTTIALSEPLQAGDLLWFSGPPSSIGELRKIPGLISNESEEVDKISGKVFDRRLVQAVVAREGTLVGKTIKEVRFRTLYGAAVIAVHREGKRVHEFPGNIKLRAGDVLLLEAGPSFMSKRMQQDRSFALIAEVENSAPPRMRMLIPALILTFGAYGCFVAKLSSLIGCSMVAAILMVAMGIMSESEARNAIRWDIYLTIASAFGIGQSLVNSGVAETAAQLLVKVGDAIDIGEAGLLGAVYLSTVIISQLVANNAAAALIFPIAVKAAESSKIDLVKMSYTIMLAASAAFMTPFGYQTNLMIMGPGFYTTTDFLIFGTPMQVVLWFTTTLALVSPLWLSWLSSLAVLLVVAAFRLIGDRNSKSKSS